ncbi:MAG: DUF2779 domain-containing protein [Calditrichaeota bacterium]|nr:DUF2779 domain-containing protein [Calditrichota bacterium]
MALHQCPLRLWNEVHRRDLMQAPSAEAQARFDAGTMVGELARDLYPQGRLIAEKYWEIAMAKIHTNEALADKSIPALFEPAFEYRQTRVRCDILVRGKGGWQLWEVKSVVNPKEYHVLDVAIQAHVLKKSMEASGSDCNFENIGVVHLNNEYVYDGKKYDANSLFSRFECLDEALDIEIPVEDLISEGLEIATSTIPPQIKPGGQCTDPYDCPFLGSACDVPERHPLMLVPGVGPAKLESLIAQGINTLDDLAASSVVLNGPQQRMMKAEETGQCVVEPTLSEYLAAIGYPRYHLDFETFMPALPRYKGTRPFQALPFQYSVHFEESERRPAQHFGYLHSEDSDPRRLLTEHMLDVLEQHPDAPVLMYTAYEKRVLNALADELPEYADRLNTVADRLVDLCAIVKDNIYHPDFNGSFSIKSVLPALVPELGYDDLEIADGTAASLKYMEMIELAKSDKTSAKVILNQLWEYCKRDTEAMIAVVSRLNILSAGI